MAWLGLSLRTSVLPLRLSASRVNSRFPWEQRTQWRCLCETNTDSANFSFPKELKDITVVDSTRGAVRAVQTLAELPLDRRVAWSTQLYKPSVMAATSSEHVLSASAYAGDDLDFGNGPHLFISGGGSRDDSEIWNLLRRYFQTHECRKVWFNYSASMRALALKDVRPKGFSGDIVHMNRLYHEKTKRGDMDAIAKAVLTKSTLAKSYLLWEKNNMSKDEVSTRLRDAKGKLDDVSTTSERIARACCDASLMYRLDERLRHLLKKQPVHGDAYNTLNGTSAMHRNEDVFNLLDAYETFFLPMVKAFYDIEVEGLPLDFGLLHKVANEEEHTKKLLEDEFRRWASTFSSDALYMDISVASQLQQLLFAPCENIHNKKESLGPKTSFKVSRSKRGEMPETEEGKKRGEIVLTGAGIKPVSHTRQGWPSVSSSALREALEEYIRNPPKNALPGFSDAMESLLQSMEIGRRLKWYANPKKIGYVTDNDGRIRMQYKTDFFTGRLVNSSNGKEWEPVMLQCISPGRGNDLIHVQYSDLEMWTVAQLSGCTSLRGRMNSENNADILLAYELFLRSSVEDDNTSLSEVSHEQCHAASMLDKAMRKGGQVNMVERLVGCTREEAGRMMKTWYDLHPGVLTWRKEREAFISEYGFAETYMGRRRKVKHGRVGEGVGFIVDGTAAEIVIGGIISLRREERISALGWRVVHADRDVIVLEGPTWSADAVLEGLERIVCRPTGFELDVLPRVVVYHVQGEKEQTEDQVLQTTTKD